MSFRLYYILFLFNKITLTKWFCNIFWEEKEKKTDWEFQKGQKKGIDVGFFIFFFFFLAYKYNRHKMRNAFLKNLIILAP